MIKKILAIAFTVSGKELGSGDGGQLEFVTINTLLSPSGIRMTGPGRSMAIVDGLDELNADVVCM